MAADAAERLTNLIALLLETSEPLTFEEIGDRLIGQYPEGESARHGAFERDKRLLREEGVPLDVTVLSGDRAGATAYSIDRRRYELPDPGLTEAEKRAVQLAVATVRLDPGAGTGALWKLGAGDDDGAPAAVTASLPDLPELRRVFDANVARATIGFRYRAKRRVLEPWGLLARNGFWYVIGLDRDVGAKRSYRVDRIEGMVDVGPPGSWSRPEGFDPKLELPDDPKMIGDGDAFEALVLVDGQRAAKVAREVGADAVVEWRADGSVVVRASGTNRTAFRSWVLSYLQHAEVLEPAELRDDMVAWLTEIEAGP